MVLKHSDYRRILSESLSERCANNPQYSLRAFARDLKLTPSQLSLILNRSKGLSPARAESIARGMGFTKNETQYFCDLVQSEHGRSKVAKQTAKKRLQKYGALKNSQNLEADAFRVISDWYHFAIHQMMRLAEKPSADQTTAWISRRLQIPQLEAKAALERLERLELIEKKGTHYAVCSDTVFAPDGVPSEGLRSFHRQVLAKASLALVEQDLERRYFNTTFVAIDAEDIPRAKAQIKDFHQHFMNEFSPDEKTSLDRVYCLSVQLFDLMKLGSGEQSI